MLANWGWIPGRGHDGNFTLCHHVQTSSGAHPASYPMGTGILTLEVKWPGCEADHSTPSSTKVKNVWGYTSTPPVAWCLVKHRTTLLYCTYAWRQSSHWQKLLLTPHLLASLWMHQRLGSNMENHGQALNLVSRQFCMILNKLCKSWDTIHTLLKYVTLQTVEFEF